MKFTKLFALPFLLFIGLSLHVSAQHGVAASQGTVDANGIEWLTFEEAVKRHEQEPKKFIIDVYTDWCGWCKKMDASTFHNPVVVQNVKENYYAIKMDGEYKGDIPFRGRTYKFISQGRRGYHELPAELMGGRMSYPTIVFLDEEYNIIQSLPGFRSAKDLDPILSYFAGNFYTETPWETFVSEYKSPVTN